MVKVRPSISIVIPHFNQRSQLKRLIDTVSGSLHYDDEVIIVDDKSDLPPTDFVSGLLGVKLILLDANGGAANARNTGVKAAKNEFVAFLDADDVPLIDRFDNQVEFLLQNPQCCACVGGFIYKRKGGGEFRPKNLSRKVDIFPQLCGGNIFSAGSTLMFRRASFLALDGYNSDLRVYEDWDLLLRANSVGQVGHCGHVVSEISSSTRRTSMVQQLSTLDFLHATYLSGLKKSEKLLFEQAICYERSSAYWNANNIPEMLREILFACRSSPLTVIKRIFRRVFLRAP